MNGTLILTGQEIASLLSMEECIQAVEDVFRLHGEGRAPAPHLLGIHVEGGGFHIKAGVLPLERPYFVAKLNGNFPRNAERAALPTIQGLVALCDAGNGFPLAILDSVEITRLRTAAATAVAAKYLARPDTRTAAIFGCGVQAPAQIRALRSVLPIERVFCHDLDPLRARSLARTIGESLKIEAAAASDVEQAAASADIIVTCTPSTRWFLGRRHVRPGVFVAAVGADNESKQEVEPELLRDATVVVDSLAQCASIGDLHHAVAAALLSPENVPAELGQVVAGLRPGRTSAEEIIVFDSTGLALQDAAAAVAVYHRARDLTSVLRVRLACPSEGTLHRRDALSWGL